ncbi:MAG: hypothetical protein JWO94_3101 [Verrucomicrobiaceae bacterium]|nr:hypothetical protein [Verrucomicrobiaceae bacterium]
MHAQLLCLAAAFISLASLAADAVPDPHYFDETGMRHLVLTKAGADATRVTIRFATDPGSASLWTGIGQRKDKQLVFAQEVEDGADRGTFYIANISDSKVDIIVKPGQKKGLDASLAGTYHHASEQKLQQLAKKEAQAASTRLQTAFKNASKKWSAADRPALSLWKDQWPGLRDRWMEISLTPPKMNGPAKPAATAPPPPPPPPLLSPGTASNPADKPAAYWFKLAEVTAHGYAFVETAADPKTGTDWEAEYDDFAGGHVSITKMRDGGLHVTLSISRVGDTQAGTMDALVKAGDVSKDKSGNLSADFVVADPEVTDTAQRARIHLTRMGRYLQVEAQQTQHYSLRGWFEGIYRGSPPPKE